MKAAKDLVVRATAIGNTGGDWWPGSSIGPRGGGPVSLRVLEYSNWTRQRDAIARAQEILDAGFSASACSTEN